MLDTALGLESGHWLVIIVVICIFVSAVSPAHELGTNSSCCCKSRAEGRAGPPGAAKVSRYALWYQAVLISPKGIVVIIAALQPLGWIEQVVFICARAYCL